jgi:hypothetical protein
MLIVFAQPDLLKATDNITLDQCLFFNFFLRPGNVLYAGTFVIRLCSGKSNGLKNGVFNTNQ